MKLVRTTLIFLSILISLLSFKIGVYAQAGTPIVAAVQNGNLVITEPSTPIIVNNPKKFIVGYPTWNMAGTQIAYTMTSDYMSWYIAVAGASGKDDPLLLDVGQLEQGFELSWTPDGQILFAQDNGSGKTNIMQIAPQAGASPASIGSVDYIGAEYMGQCGTGRGLPVDLRYEQEAGYEGSAPILQWTKYGILHSTSCTHGLALYTPKNQKDTSLPTSQHSRSDHPYLRRAVLANDGKTLAALQGIDDSLPTSSDTVVVIDLSTLQVADVKTTEHPDRLAWSPDGDLFYNTLKPTDDPLTYLSPEQHQKIEANHSSLLSDNLSNYEVTIHHLNMKSGDDKVIYTASAFAVGRMEATADGKGLVFSQISNMGSWLEKVANGDFDGDEFASRSQQATIAVTLNWLSVDGKVTVLGDDMSQFSLKPST